MSDAAPIDASASDTGPEITGRCYCGAVTLKTRAEPQTVAYCHCSDCRRWTGGPVAAFAAFATEDVHVNPPLGPSVSHNSGVERWFCRDCGSPLAAAFDYLPGQIYVPLGILDQADDLPPRLHCHTGSRLGWMQINDELEHVDQTARDLLAVPDKPIA